MEENKLHPEMAELTEDLLEEAAGGTRAYVIYIVQRGDNLHKIADYFGVSWRDIYKLNKRTIGDDPNLIYAGQRLKIPQ